ncbi:hypothetical protein SAMN05421678_105184 [Actinopolymorpha cephalotaxi]|uniref:Cellulose synthase n=1 Tax=Actinopolymorpha cephalotaxi TaxID=504797 RepID=A0A1I2R7F2_9ACTN|nr:hypothetical protein [Actinopolymorpha cephalotaxi]NYH82409.1 hypothetical protein [Actinopolymorpha cephalotaxi]SFG33841.1 hypothetical protein SAMN05421678_105184 [Actinopolymorpha cephalotaxi]
MYDDATWFPVCAGLSALGVVAAFFAFRRRGAAAGIRLFGWAVLPMAIYLTGMVRLLWTVGAALVKWVSGFVFSPYVWSGLALFGVAAICLPVAAAMRRRQAARAGEVETGRASTGTRAGSGAVGSSAAGTAGTAGSGRTGTAKDAGKPKQVEQGKGPAKRQGTKGGKGKEEDPLAEFEDIDEILKRRGIS